MSDDLIKALTNIDAAITEAESKGQDTTEMKAEAKQLAQALDGQKLSEQEQAVSKEEQGFLGAALETGKTLGQGAVAEIGGGLAGLARGAYNQSAETGILGQMGVEPSDVTAAEQLAITRQKLAPGAPSERSQAQLQDIGVVAENVTEGINRGIMSGLVGAGELATGQGLEQSSQSIKDVGNKGLGQTLGDRILEETGNEELATLAYSSPTLVMELLGLKGGSASAKAASQGIKKGVEQGVDATQEGLAKVKEGRALALSERDGIPKESLKKADIRKGIEEGSRYAVEWKIDPVSKKIVKDDLAKKALSQGIDDTTVAITKYASAADKAAFSEMMDIASQVLEKPLGSSKVRPQKVIGDNLMDRYDKVYSANQKAAKDIGLAVDKMEGKSFDITDSLDNYDDALSDLGITRNKDTGELVFKGSDIQGNQITSVIDMVDKRLKGNYSAKNLHKEKQFIADKIYEKGKDVANPLDNKGKKVLNDLRDSFNQKLRNSSDEYIDANDRFSETIEGIGDFSNTMGRRFDPDSPRVENLVGKELRKILSNYSIGDNQKVAVENLDYLASRYGGKFDDDIVHQVEFYSALEKQFGSFAPNSVQGTGEKIIKGAELASGTNAGAALEAAKWAHNKIMDVNERNAVKALKDLVNEGKTKNKKANPRQKWQQQKQSLLNGLGKMEGAEEEILTILLEGGMEAKAADKIIKSGNRSRIEKALHTAKRRTLRQQ